MRSYIVTHRVSSDPISPFALDEVGDLATALAHATKLLSFGHLGVAIQDGGGRKYSATVLLRAAGETRN